VNLIVRVSFLLLDVAIDRYSQNISSWIKLLLTALSGLL
jgi:hypothetical protein